MKLEFRTSSTSIRLLPHLVRYLQNLRGSCSQFFASSWISPPTPFTLEPYVTVVGLGTSDKGKTTEES